MIELTVIGGYLGSGKTTLLNEILGRTNGDRTAVIVNDFGTVNIDAKIIGTRNGSAWEIANGCICCDLSDGMAAAIEAIRNAEPPVTRAFVEVSGVGQPDVVARWGDHPGFFRGGAVVCADVTSIRRATARKWVGETVAAQLRGADRLLLTKTDLVEPEQIAEVTQWLASLPGVDAEVIDRARVLDEVVLDRPSITARAKADSSSEAQVSAQLGVELHVDHETEEHLREHSSWAITTTSAVDAEDLRALVLALPEDFVRVKGIIADRHQPGHRVVVHFDGTRFDTQDFGLEDRIEGRNEEGRLVLIATGAYTGTPKAVTTLARAIRGTVDD